MSKLMDKLLKAGSVKHTAILSESKFFTKKDLVKTSNTAINVAYSGEVDGGMISGLTVIAGPSKHYKSNIGLIGIKAYFDKYKDAVCLFYDSEYGCTPEYLESHGVDASRIIHIPIEHVEQLKFDLVKRMEDIDRGDHVIIFVDSLGNLASKKEVEDAENEKSVADMSRAKSIKSLFRIITPSLTTKDIPCLVINHTYQEMGLYPKAIVSGGTGIYYSANTIFIVGRSQEKGSDGEIEGYNFTLNIEKSRFVREKSKIPLKVTFEGGVSKYSGVLDWGLESGHIIKPANGWYQLVNVDTGEMIGGKVRLKDTENEQFLGSIIKQESFKTFVKNKYKLSGINTNKNAETESEDEEMELTDD